MANTENNHDEPNRYTMDIRVFLAVITVVMAASFTLGVAIGPAQSAPQISGLVQSVVNEVTGVGMTAQVEGDHEPAGQHLLVDIKGIDADFLDSEARLSKAMVDTVEDAGLTMLSYHCHALVPKGVSCVGVLLESHISFHTWPDEGVITLDLFTCGEKPLIPVVKTIKKLFGIGESIQIQWSHELRGFRRSRARGNDSSFALLDHNSDLSQLVWSPFDCTVKEQVVSILTKYQRVDIWDLVGLDETPSHQDAMKHNLQPGDPRWLNNEIVTPDRYLFLDGVLQSDNDSRHEYHEALVHPAMFTHSNPKNVAIVGGAEGATLFEVLKHKTIESVTMIEIDGELIDIVREYMPSMSNCSDLVGRAENCFDDELTNLVVDDAKQWFLNRYGPNPTEEAAKDPYDVIIIDAIEPEVSVGLSQDLYINENVLSAIVKSMADDGVLAFQVGRAPNIFDPRPDIGVSGNREKLFRILESFPEIEAMFVYEDPHCGFVEPRAFMVACKDKRCREHWYATADVVDFKVYDRIVRTESKDRALVYFDGVTMLGYQVAPKAWETVYCRREPTPFECDYRHLDLTKPIFEYNVDDEAAGDFLVSGDWSEDGSEVLATHVFANKDIPKGAYIMPEHLASSLVLSRETFKGLKGNLEYGGVAIIEDFVEFIQDFGHESLSEGSGQVFVEVGASYLIKEVETLEEANVGRWVPSHPTGKRPKYSPVYERHRHSFDVFMVALKDISKGTELLKYDSMWNE